MNESNDRSVSFSQLLRQRRLALRIRQSEIADALHVSAEIVSHWEAGRRRPQLNKIPPLAGILRLDVKDVCRVALFEWHPRFHAALFGTARPAPPHCIDAARQETGSSRNLLPAGSAASQVLKPGVIVGEDLGQPKQLA